MAGGDCDLRGHCGDHRPKCFSQCVSPVGSVASFKTMSLATLKCRFHGDLVDLNAMEEGFIAFSLEI